MRTLGFVTSLVVLGTCALTRLEAAPLDLLPVQIGTLSNGVGVVFEVNVTRRRGYFPVLDSIITASRTLPIQTPAQAREATNFLRRQSTFDRRFVDGSLVLHGDVRQRAPEILSFLNERLPRLIGPIAFAEMKDDFKIEETIAVNPSGSVSLCTQDWIELRLSAHVGHLKVASVASVARCDEEFDTGIKPSVHFVDGLSQFANEPFVILQRALRELNVVIQ